MCGIAGVLDPSDARRADVEAQLRCLDHRGPDSWGIYGAGPALIGQTRLAIIDLVTGDPPITNEDGAVGVALNGEIYNYAALGEDLRREGHKLATECDTEVIAHLAEDLEPVELARRLEGMFAFAVWDSRRQRLVLGRDRMGKKPLYYWTDGRRLAFGSEIKAVLAHPLVPRELDQEAVPAYLTFGYVPTPRSFFVGIESVPPGHVLTVDLNGNVRLDRYWEPQVPGVGGVTPLDISLDEAAGEVRRLLTAAVERRLVSDVPLGAFLSGGIDSSAVVGAMATVSPRPVRTFTIGFEDKEGFDERPYARMVAERFATDHVEFVVQPDAINLVERLVWHHDQPFGDSSAIPTFLLSELTRRHVTVALCGDGGDELFAGYQRFAAALALVRYQAVPAVARRALTGAVGLLPPDTLGGRAGRAKRFLARSELDIADAFRSWVSYVPVEWRDRILGPSSDWAIADYREKWARSAGGDLLDRLLDVTLRTYLLDDLLPKVDRMAMAHALEVRSPLLDRQLVEFALRLPRSARLRGTVRKRVLKRAVQDLLPEGLLHRPKRGFAVPLDRWFRSDLRSYYEGTVGSPSARLRSHVRPDALDALWAEHQAGTANHRDTLWTLLTLEVFLRREGW
ncbi:MAG: asparagine synthase (glutamine-hydrolyzing) [Actinomycetota bacterium]|nr:asparagine synthase (glutamine-hydrolyzing) [Actinomycetota bacterium]